MGGALCWKIKGDGHILEALGGQGTAGQRGGDMHNSRTSVPSGS